MERAIITSEDIQGNINDIKQNTVRQGDVDIIAHQTGLNDTLYIERVLIECNNDIAMTILKLMGATTKTAEVVKEPSAFEQIRMILDEKEKLFYDVMANKSMRQ
jgi:hypothetical protein